MGAGRRGASASRKRNGHADIQTPSWRPFVVPSSPNPAEIDFSDDDTSDEAYIKRHDELALEERRRWAGPSVAAKPSTPNTNKRTRAASSSKPTCPLFPTPTECFYLVRRSLQKLRRQHGSSYADDRSKLRNRQALFAEIESMLLAYADVEDSLNRARRQLNKHGAKQTNAATKRKLEFRSSPVDFAYANNTAASHGQPSRASAGGHLLDVRSLTGRTRHSPLPSSPPLPSAVSIDSERTASMLSAHAVSKANLLSEVFRREMRDFLQKVADIARDARIELTQPLDFRAVHTAFARARKRSEASLKTADNKLDLGELIRREIDEDQFPLLAQTFTLHPQYCLDGTRNEPEKIAADEHLDLPTHVGEEARLPPMDDYGVAKIEPKVEAEPSYLAGVLHRQTGANGNATGQLSGGENDSELILPSSSVLRLGSDARRKLRENVKRKLPRAHSETHLRRPFRMGNDAESVYSDSSTGTEGSGWLEVHREQAAKATAARRTALQLAFQPVVDIDEPNESGEPSVVNLDEEQ